MSSWNTWLTLEINKKKYLKMKQKYDDDIFYLDQGDDGLKKK